MRIFTKSENPPKEEVASGLLEERIEKKAKGNLEVYDVMAGGKYGVDALVAFREDLEPERFSRILKERMLQEDFHPLEVITQLNMGVYQYYHVTYITADYLEAARKIKDWEWMFHLHMSYGKLYILSQKLATIFRSGQDFEQSLTNSRPVLDEMREILAEIIKSMEAAYPRATR
jgi:hypothetical protein